MGPDLTSIASRFTKREILESVLFPSHVIPSQYASKTLILKDGRTVAGLVAPGAAGEVLVLQSNGQKVAVRESAVDETQPSKISSMPAGLLDELTPEEIADLFAYLAERPTTGVTRRIEK